ncbi:unnamed protein product [Prorocentrum cordatum]|uniref:Uncharacterized protein n=1 Tax=Prorocentrum cordatum TaxID=2364126 RepID=A0ABN9U577_9DINO|nr:unnamed protein product [Polarella glacialis]
MHVYVRLQAALPHLAEQRECLLPLAASFTRADSSRIADGIGLKLCLPHLAQKSHSSLPLLALLARADRSVEAMTSGSSFASHISPNSARAPCHCLPFSHALIPVL